ncbi:GNAT family N-acetyltransferase [Ensifer sp. M14]|uniref:GNAT family N-acetyltransferase n=1 Tax=Ensifer sp. M14 TaxID=2203782 RepID=UPI000E1C4D58|nr:GNAT family N-acetyltransferase [Ensifer sp. M14]
MISFRPMLESEYAGYLAYFVPDYAAEIAANYGLPDADALAQATSEIAEDLPQGVDTPGNVLLCLIESANAAHVGYLWYRPDARGRSAFISDFHILPEHQGKGLGKLAMAALEIELSAKGFEQVKLRVAENNRRARHVYEATGFRVTGTNMSKTLKPR